MSLLGELDLVVGCDIGGDLGLDLDLDLDGDSSFELLRVEVEAADCSNLAFSKSTGVLAVLGVVGGKRKARGRLSRNLANFDFMSSVSKEL